MSTEKNQEFIDYTTMHLKKYDLLVVADSRDHSCTYTIGNTEKSCPELLAIRHPDYSKLWASLLYEISMLMQYENFVLEHNVVFSAGGIILQAIHMDRCFIDEFAPLTMQYYASRSGRVSMIQLLTDDDMRRGNKNPAMKYCTIPQQLYRFN